jgi:hypothetical protein
VCAKIPITETKMIDAIGMPCSKRIKDDMYSTLWYSIESGDHISWSIIDHRSSVDPCVPSVPFPATKSMRIEVRRSALLDEYGMIRKLVCGNK